VCAVIQFLLAEDFAATEIHHQVEEVYRPQVISVCSVLKRCLKFATGRTSLLDKWYNGRPVSFQSDNSVAYVECMVQEDRHVT
jgi:hypothetical protein